MQHRRYIGMVSVLLIGAILLVFIDPWGSLRKESRRISLQDPSAIDRIILSDAYDSTGLEKRDNAWYISGDEPANPVAVENLLYAAEKLQINSIHPATPEWDRQMVRRVRFYDGKKLVLNDQIGTVENRFLVKSELSDQIFSVSMPGYAGLDLNRVFSCHADHYREHMLIDLLPSEIRYIEVEPKGEEPFRFTMDEQGEITCSLPDLDSILSPGELDELSIRLLFSYFTSIRYEEQAGDVPCVQSEAADQERWLARLYVESRQGETHSLNVFSMPGEGGTKNQLFYAIVLHNGDPEPLVIKYIYLDVLMRGLDSYRPG
ncbi:MAG: hypothetical protein V2B15_06630 [Bacteroidota bacterium]